MTKWFEENLLFEGVKNYVDNLSEGLEIPPTVIIQNMIIRRIAEEDAAAAIYGAGPALLAEFMDQGGELVTGQELYEKIKSMETDRLEKEYISNLAAVPVEALSEHDLEILKRHGQEPERKEIQIKEKQNVEDLKKKYNIPKKKPGQGAYWEK